MSHGTRVSLLKEKPNNCSFYWKHQGKWRRRSPRTTCMNLKNDRSLYRSFSSIRFQSLFSYLPFFLICHVPILFTPKSPLIQPSNPNYHFMPRPIVPIILSKTCAVEVYIIKIYLPALKAFNAQTARKFRTEKADWFPLWTRNQRSDCKMFQQLLLDGNVLFRIADMIG